MVHWHNDETKKIVWKQIEKDEKLGDQVGGSGHLGYVDCSIDNVNEPKKVPEGWEITYQYMVSVTTEFTVYPDNPPQETLYEKIIIVNDNGKIIKEGERRIISTNVEWEEPIDSELNEEKDVHS